MYISVHETYCFITAGISSPPRPLMLSHISLLTFKGINKCTGVKDLLRCILQEIPISNSILLRLLTHKSRRYCWSRKARV